ncbi:MAG: hypothetical protein AAGF96_12075 [Bacteroidota bacterium]
MVVLKKIKGATLMETLVATVLIVVLFMLASQLMNTLFATTIRQDDSQLRQEVLRLQYRYENHRLEVPYATEKAGWEISVEKSVWASKSQIIISARHTATGKELLVNRIDE